MERNTIGKHDYAASCDPQELAKYGFKTFSAGVFEWVHGAGGPKRGPVKVRVSGLVGNASGVYAVATLIAEGLDAGEYKGPKNVRVKP